MAQDQFNVKINPTFSTMYGAQMLAQVINTFLYGISFLLVLQYFKMFSKSDPMTVKVTVALLLVFATMATAFSAHQSYDSFIKKFGRQDLFDEIITSVPLEFLSTYITAFIAQLFFATRIWSVSKSLGPRFRMPTIPVVLLSFVQLSAGIAQVSLMIRCKTYSRLNYETSKLIVITAVQGSAAALCDIIITASLCWVFSSHRTGIKRTNSLIDKLIRYAINRAAATSICAMLNVFLYYFASGSFYFLIALLATTHLYVISAVTVLTSRESLREDMDRSFHISDLIMSNKSDSEGPTPTVDETRPNKEVVEVV